VQISKWPKADTNWYLGVLCRKCQSPILFALDKSEGKQEFASIPKLVLTCSQDTCGHQADYSKARVSRFQKPKQQQIPKRPASNKRTN
jgi:hypothetical protein